MRNNVVSIWTPERIGKLKELWESGASAAEIGAQFGTTRNAVLGKIYRLGLSEPKAVFSVKRSKAVERSWDKRDRAAVPSRRTVPKVKPLPQDLRCVEIDPLNISIVDLGPTDCRYPYGEGSEITFCGHPKTSGRSYCMPHARLTLDGEPRRSRADSEVFRRESRAKHRQGLLEVVA